MKRSKWLCGLLCVLVGCGTGGSFLPGTPTVTPAMRESCWWADDTLLTNVMIELARFRDAGYNREEALTSFLAGCYGECVDVQCRQDCLDCSLAMFNQVWP